MYRSQWNSYVFCWATSFQQMGWRTHLIHMWFRKKSQAVSCIFFQVRRIKHCWLQLSIVSCCAAYFGVIPPPSSCGHYSTNLHFPLFPWTESPWGTRHMVCCEFFFCFVFWSDTPFYLSVYLSMYPPMNPSIYVSIHPIIHSMIHSLISFYFISLHLHAGEVALYVYFWCFTWIETGATRISGCIFLRIILCGGIFNSVLTDVFPYDVWWSLGYSAALRCLPILSKFWIFMWNTERHAWVRAVYLWMAWGPWFGKYYFESWQGSHEEQTTGHHFVSTSPWSFFLEMCCNTVISHWWNQAMCLLAIVNEIFSPDLIPVCRPPRKLAFFIWGLGSTTFQMNAR